MKKITVYADFDFLEQRDASEIIEEVRTAIKDWRKTATELKISHNILESYCNRWDNL